MYHSILQNSQMDIEIIAPYEKALYIVVSGVITVRTLIGHYYLVEQLTRANSLAIIILTQILVRNPIEIEKN